MVVVWWEGGGVHSFNQSITFTHLQGSCVGGRSSYAPNSGVEVWRCAEDLRSKQGGKCNFDLCDQCRVVIEAK